MNTPRARRAPMPATVAKRGLRRQLSFVLAVVVGALTLVAGCSSSGSGGKTTVKIITWVNPPAVAAFKKINAEFEKKYPDIHVQLSTAENVNGPYATLLRTSVSSASADIVMDNHQMQPFPLKVTRDNLNPAQFYASQGVFLPLNDQPALKNLAPAAKQAMTYKGDVQGLLSGHYDWIVFYNKATFAKYGLTAPTTYNDFLKVCETLKSHGVTPIWLGSGGAPQYVSDFLTVPLMGEQWLPNVPGKDLARALETGQTKWTDPHFTEALNREKTISQYLEKSYTGEQWQGMPTAFAGNKSAMLLDGSWDLASIQKANPKIQVGSFPLPGSDNPADNQPIVANDLWLAVVKKAVSNSKVKAATLKWLNFFASKPIYAQYVNMTGISASIPGTYTGYAAKVLGKYFTSTSNALPAVLPTLGTNQGYWTQEANFPTAQINLLTGDSSVSEVQNNYAKDWKT